MDIYIYALNDPRTHSTRYVGKSTNPKQRYKAHLSHARHGALDHKAAWIRSLLAVDLKPELEILERCEGEWGPRECYWIEHYKALGCDLTNCKDGGSGYNYTPEVRAKMSAAKKGKSPHNKGSTTPPEVRAKQRESAKRRWEKMDADARRVYWEKGLAKNRVYPPAGWHHTEEAKQKISQAGKGNKHRAGRENSAEQRQQHSERMKSRYASMTPEDRADLTARIREGWKRRREQQSTKGTT